MTLLRLVLGVVALTSVLGAVSRLAALAVPRGSLRAIAAAVLAAAALVAHSLLLGLVSWGTSPVALAAAAVATAGLVRLTTPVPTTTLVSDAAAAVGGLSGTGRALAGAAVGTAGAWLIWLWRWPYVGYDGMVQNLLEITIWIHQGTPGSQHRVFGMAPIEAFPMTNDVLLSWGMSFGRSFAVAAPWTLASVVLLVLALATVMRSLAVPRALTVVATASVFTIPHVVGLVNTPKSDIPALAWLACCAAAALGARDHPRLIGISLVAGGLSVGSKTTTAPLVVVVLVSALWAHRSRLRPVFGWVIAGTVAATATGGIWYLRNLVDHGSPVWPMGSTPWGDPLPPLFEHAGDTFFEAPRATFTSQGRRWIGVAGAALALPPLAVLVGVVTRRAAIRWLSVAAVFALVLWGQAPVTGLSNDPLAGDVLTSTTRYLLPAAALGAVTVAAWAVSIRQRVAAFVVMSVLATGNVVLVMVHVGPGPMMPAAAYLAVGAVVGAALGSTATVTGPRWRREEPTGTRWRSAPVGVAVTAAALVVAAIGVEVSASGWTTRHREVLLFGGDPVHRMLADERFQEGDEVVYVTNIAWSDLVGDRIAHEVQLLTPGISCEALTDILSGSWLVLIDNDFFGLPDRPLDRGCLTGVAPFADDGSVTVFAPAANGATR